MGILALEIFLLAVKRGRDAVTPGDQGTLRSVWMLICGGCLVGFLLAPKLSFLRWPETLAIVLLADVLLLAGIALRVWAIVPQSATSGSTGGSPFNYKSRLLRLTAASFLLPLFRTNPAPPPPLVR